MDELIKKIEEQQVKIDAMYISVEKLRKYFLWTLIITGVTILLPLVAIAFILPSLINTLGSAYGIGGIQ
jgi:type IV secretory pathway component VirB8